jgi:hypothetical protein
MKNNSFPMNPFILHNNVKKQLFYNYACAEVIEKLNKYQGINEYLPSKVLVEIISQSQSYMTTAKLERYAIVRLSSDLVTPISKNKNKNVIDYLKMIVVDSKIIIQYVFLHEVAHIIFSKANDLLYGNVNKDLCKWIPFFNTSLNNKVFDLLSENIEEAFCDIFAAHILKQLYPENTVLIQKMKQFRFHTRKIADQEAKCPIVKKMRSLYKKYDMASAYDYMLSKNLVKNSSIKSIIFESTNAAINCLVNLINHTQDINVICLLISSLEYLDQWQPYFLSKDIPLSRIVKLNQLLEILNPKLENKIAIHNIAIDNKKLLATKKFIRNEMIVQKKDIFEPIFQRIEIVIDQLYITAQS